jgi:murein DD-endopeptidase MepM/ murein hydrolase activator NlpD
VSGRRAWWRWSWPLLLVVACDPAAVLEERRPVPATAHEAYARRLLDAGLDSTALGREWLAASDSALPAAHGATPPAREAGVYRRDEARAVAWRVALRDGQRLTATVQTDGPPARLFLDLFEATGDSVRPFVHRATAEPAAREGPDDAEPSPASGLRLAFEARRSGDYVLRLQPELLRAGRYELVLEVGPTLAFPVEGQGNRAIQSFFGADREAGRRVHHGIDIFAERGTPVLAATDGVVRSTNPNTLGGNVVWLSDVTRGQSLYYAHLDAHAVVAGQVVRRGDTLGFVGNTGNARTTPPHLHFGIYRRGEGPVDPLPHVRLVSARPPGIAADTATLGLDAELHRRTTVLHRAPDARSEVLRDVPPRAPVRVMGASARWYRVHLEDGVAGYVIASAVTGPVRSETAASGVSASGASAAGVSGAGATGRSADAVP